MANAASSTVRPVRGRIAGAIDLVVLLVIASFLFAGCSFIEKITYVGPDAASLSNSQRATLRWNFESVTIDGVLMRDEVDVGWFSTSGTVTRAAKITPGKHEVRWERIVGAHMGFRGVGGHISFVADPGRTYELKSRRASFFRPQHCGWIEEAETGSLVGGEPQC